MTKQLPLLLPLLLAACATAPQTGFLDRQVEVDGKSHKYVLYIPEDYDPARPWPLILFLHGIGERGADGLLQTEVGIGRAIRRHRERFPCLVLLPQCPQAIRWDKAVKQLDAILAATRRDHPVDPDRIALTGLSMGGFGAWTYGALRPDTFSALVPICGWAERLPVARLKGLPVWAFHGSTDPVIPAARTRELVEALQEAGGTARYTEYPGVGHNAWDRTYADPAVIRFLLKGKHSP